MADAGIDCVDLVSGGVAGVVVDSGRGMKGKGKSGEPGPGTVVLDPCPAEHEEVRAAAVVGYLAERDEITELWVKGHVGADAEVLIESAVEAAVSSRTVLVEAVREAAQAKFMQPAENGAAVGSKEAAGSAAADVVMSG
ncbi:3'-5'-exoribonuclease [Coniosporium tulheliwenetii]|nr:3'-5'-exoribonuclease [Cladosporium sp. JES 115]